jgi:ethanolaminephosphotransferase
MCIRPISNETLNKMNEFKYKYKNDSLLYNKIMSPCLDKAVNFLPKNIAPNLITFLSLMCNVFAFIITINDGGYNFSQTLKTSTCYVIGLTQLLYQLLDNIDGKQARRTRNATPFGMLMDHGCDIFTNIFTAFNVSKLLMVGNHGFYSFSVFFGLFVGFHMMTYEDYKLGEMHFPAVNGVDEGNFSIFVLGVLCGIYSQDWLKRPINLFFFKLNLTYSNLGSLVIFFGGLFAWFNLYYHTFNKKGCLENFKTFFDNMSFYSCIFVPYFYIYEKKIFYQLSKWILFLNTSLIFARVTMDLQIKIATMDSFKCNIMFVFSNLIYIISIFIDTYLINYYWLLVLALIQAVELSFFIYLRANQITEYLDIEIFCIDKHELI